MPVTYAKALIFLALVASSVTIAESMSGNGTHTLEKPRAPHFPLARERYLRSDVGGELPPHLGEMGVLSRFRDFLRREMGVLSRFRDFLRPIHERWQQIKVDREFERLKLDKHEGLIYTKTYDTWLSYTMDVCYNDRLKAEKFMFSSMVRLSSPDYVTPILAATQMDKATQREAEALLRDQAQIWVDYGKTADDVFKLLKLDRLKYNALFRSNLFSQWGNFLMKKESSAAIESMYTTLSGLYGDDLAATLAAESNVADTSAFVPMLLEHQCKKWSEGSKSEEDVFKLLKLEENAQLFNHPAASAYLSYLYHLGKGDSDVLNMLEVKFSDIVVAEMLNKATKEGPLGERVRKLQVAQWLKVGGLWEEKRGDNLLKQGTTELKRVEDFGKFDTNVDSPPQLGRV